MSVDPSLMNTVNNQQSVGVQTLATGYCQQMLMMLLVSSYGY
jgi:hypothetical protein